MILTDWEKELVAESLDDDLGEMVVGVMVFEGVSDKVGGMNVGSGTGGRRLDLNVGIELWEREGIRVE